MGCPILPSRRQPWRPLTLPSTPFSQALVSRTTLHVLLDRMLPKACSHLLAASQSAGCSWIQSSLAVILQMHGKHPVCCCCRQSHPPAVSCGVNMGQLLRSTDAVCRLWPGSAGAERQPAAERAAVPHHARWRVHAGPAGGRG